MNMEYKYKIHEIIFTRDDEAIIIHERCYDWGAAGLKYSGQVPDTGAARYYSEDDCYNNVDDYEKDLLDEVKEKVKDRKEEIKNAEAILKEELDNE